MCMSLLMVASLVVVVADDGERVIADLSGDGVQASGDFSMAKSPYALGGRYLSSEGQVSGAKPGRIRVAAPVGNCYVYVAWVRHPKGAKDVRIRLGDIERKVDQSTLANGLSPDDFNRNDMAQYQGLCSSGLYRITDGPVDLRQGDTLEMIRSDTEPGRFTTLDYVVFSPFLYLDDLGSDATPTGQPMINFKDYRPEFVRRDRIRPGVSQSRRARCGPRVDVSLARGSSCFRPTPTVDRAAPRAIPMQIVTTDGKHGSVADCRKIGFLRPSRMARTDVRPRRTDCQAASFAGSRRRGLCRSAPHEARGGVGTDRGRRLGAGDFCGAVGRP